MLEKEDYELQEEETTEEDDDVELEQSELKKKKLNLASGSRRSGGGRAVALPPQPLCRAVKCDVDLGGCRAVTLLPQPLCCVVEKCDVDLRGCKKYYQKHKVCEVHSKDAEVLVNGTRQRFCQQCSRFHELSEFDQMKRSCRTRLAGHNERRRKSSFETRKEGPNGRGLKAENLSFKMRRVTWMSP